MILVILFFLLLYLEKKLKPLQANSKNNIRFVIMLAALVIVLFNIYVEYSVGWKYGIPLDDDSGWIFKSADVLSKGGKWSDLYLLVARDWDLGNRVLSPSNFGQYLYATLVEYCLYYPTIFDLHVNIYLLYFSQLILISIAIIGMVLEFDKLERKKYRKVSSKTLLFFIVLLYPMIVFNSGKMLRECLFLEKKAENLHLLRMLQSKYQKLRHI